MKRCVAALSVFLLVIFCVNVSAQSFENQSVSIVSAFDAKNATALSDHFCATIELVLPGVDNVCTKAQARSYLSDFFVKQTTRTFEILHQGSRANVSFIVGKLTTPSSTFRVNMLFKKEGNLLKIYQLRVE